MRKLARALVTALGLLLGLGPATARGAAKEEVAVVQTRLGAITFRFFAADAPGHVGYVKELIRRGFYDGTTFHRVIPHFVIQGGDPNSKDADRANDGDGEADRKLKAEFSPNLHYRPGTVGMARDVDPDSGSCQFFIALENLPRLDGKYSIFGEVVSGMEVARAIADQPRDLKDNPLEPVPMTVTLKSMQLPAAILSLTAGPGGEVLTGPGKPRPYDPGDVRWKAPALSGIPGGAPPLALPAGYPLDLSVGEDGVVLDVRFARLDTPDAAKLAQQVKSDWRFTAAWLDGVPVKSRFSMEGPERRIGPSRVPGTPLDAATQALTLPRILVPVVVPRGTSVPAKPAELRLTIDESGKVAEASLQESCGDRLLDEAAVQASRTLSFAPALRGQEPVAVYLNVKVKWQETAAP